MIKPIYYSDKSHKYYFNELDAFGGYSAITVYGCDKLRFGDVNILEDKNGKKYFLGDVITVNGANGVYHKFNGEHIPKQREAEQ